MATEDDRIYFLILYWDFGSGAVVTWLNYAFDRMDIHYCSPSFSPCTKWVWYISILIVYPLLPEEKEGYGFNLNHWKTTGDYMGTSYRVQCGTIRLTSNLISSNTELFADSKMWRHLWIIDIIITDQVWWKVMSFTRVCVVLLTGEGWVDHEPPDLTPPLQTMDQLTHPLDYGPTDQPSPRPWVTWPDHPWLGLVWNDQQV